MTTVINDRAWFDVQIQGDSKDKENLIKDGNNEANDITNDSASSYSEFSSSASTTPSPELDKSQNDRLADDRSLSNEAPENFDASPRTHKFIPTETFEKRSDDLAEDDDIYDETLGQTKDRLDKKKRRYDEDDEDYTEFPAKREILSPQPVKSKRTRISDAIPDSLNVDITELLSLPQKEAATKLGISESMLCKRFKECTRRKWPYRYLRKIEKTIKNLEALRDSGTITPQDQHRLDDYLDQRRECLAPVKIRITNHDRLPAMSFSSTQYGFSSLSNDSYDNDIESDEDNFAVETLGLLRSMSPKG